MLIETNQEVGMMVMVVVVVVVVVVEVVAVVAVVFAVVVTVAVITAMAIMLVMTGFWLVGQDAGLTHNHNKERAILAGPCFDRGTESSLLNAMMERFSCAYTVIIAYRQLFSCAYA